MCYTGSAASLLVSWLRVNPDNGTPVASGRRGGGKPGDKYLLVKMIRDQCLHLVREVRRLLMGKE